MMFWFGNGYGMANWGYALMALGIVVFWLVVALGVLALVRYVGRVDRPVASWPSPQQVLADRFARGDIDEAEFRRGVDAVTGLSGPVPAERGSGHVTTQEKT